MQAELNFIRPMARKPEVDLTRADWGGALTVHPRTVEIAEAELSSDPAEDLARRGFAAPRLDGAVAFDPEDTAWREPFSEAVGRTVRRLVGCSAVMIAPASIVIRRGQGSGTDIPLAICHSDYTSMSTLAKFASLARNQPAVRSARRVAAYNVWWLAGPPPQDRPLALCDATSVAPADVTLGAAVVHDASGKAYPFGEIALFRHSPRQRWFWYPDLTPEHVLVFAGHDSDPRYASQVPHSAFANPACPAEAPTRISVECRCFAYW